MEIGKVNLKPKKNCAICFGRGYNKFIRPDLLADLYRELRPCGCIKQVIKLKDLEKIENSSHT
jgi:hypothetical protein